jgi:decaprenyl-phosphate phosphoribosyltransferase
VAAGIVAVPLAIALGIVLIIAALTLAFAVDRPLGITMVAYLAMTTAYTYALKNQPVYDIVTVAAGFVLRAIAGAAATNVPISEWFFIVTSFGALLMVVGKREGELHLLENEAGEVRSTLREYTDSYLRYVRSVASGVVLVGYCLWAFESANQAGAGNATIWFELSIVPFAIAILRYSMLLDRGEGAEPERLVLSDRGMLVAGSLWAIIYGYGVYFA